MSKGLAKADVVGDFYALPCASCANLILATRSYTIHLLSEPLAINGY